jgi:hypothetical protein
MALRGQHRDPSQAYTLPVGAGCRQAGGAGAYYHKVLVTVHAWSSKRSRR